MINIRSQNGYLEIVATMDNGRRIFKFDELKQIFALVIKRVELARDSGQWKCQIIVAKKRDGAPISAESRKILNEDIFRVKSDDKPPALVSLYYA